MVFYELKKGDDKAEIIRKNLTIAAKMREKIRLLNNNIKNSESDTKKEEVVEEIVETLEVEEDEDYRYYYDNIVDALKKCKTKKDREIAIYENLPVLNNSNYVNIVRRIILELVKDKNLLEQLKDGESKEEIDALSSEQSDLDYIIKIIRNHRFYKKEVKKDKEIEKNHLVFFKTPTGNIYAEGDLASIDFKYYPSFKELLESIEYGTFKNVKRMNATDSLFKGIAEVKDFKTRVVFDRIDKNTYIIIDIFIKKTDWDNGYLEQLQNRLAYYQSVKKGLRSEMSIEENDIIYEKLKSGLDKKVITKTKKGE